MYPEEKGMSVDQFMSQLKQETLEHNNVAYTENGAKMFGTTGKALLDLNFSVSGLRDADEETIIEKFLLALNENMFLAYKWMFYARDIREGLGERRLFNVIFKYMANTRPANIYHFTSLVPHYGRWDDLLELFDTNLEQYALATINKAWHNDLLRLQHDYPVSLLAKWLPSVNATSLKSRQQAMKICKYMNIPIPVYRKTLAKLRSHMDVVEVKMSDRRWDEIDYAKVPSRANLLYADAFMRHDPERRKAFLEKAVKGEVKIHSGDVYPHEIVHKITSQFAGYNTDDEIMALRAMWNNLPNTLDKDTRTLVVCDGSSSMKRKVSGKSDVSCMDVAYALSIYFAERLTGCFRSRVVTFSTHPQFVDLRRCENIQQSIMEMQRYTEVANTNIEAVFELVLETALTNSLTQDEIPANILIISDMQFDRCVVDQYGVYANHTLFESIANRWAEYGYKLPRICFWNVYGQPESAIPMTKNDCGVALMSGFSINNAKLIMSGKLDPYEVLVEILNGERYSQIVPEIP